MDQYTVIIGDIKGSRKLSDYHRHEWQLFLKSAIVQINEDCKADIEAAFMITKGDEFQGVLRKISAVPSLVAKFERLVYPLNLRFGIGYGMIQRLGSNIPIEMDGKAFHRANTALQIAKKKKQMVNINSGYLKFDLMVNTIYQLIAAIKSRWSETTFKRHWQYAELGTYEQVAEREGVSTQAVWDSLNHGHAIDVMDAERALHELFLNIPVENNINQMVDKIG
ncbi:MAG: hypothetical protein GF313_08085 [Caldithrix sp.]|nr:hypothetical protein [Caldithrix sp.]